MCSQRLLQMQAPQVLALQWQLYYLYCRCVLHCAQCYWKCFEVLLVEDTKLLIRWGVGLHDL